MSRAIRLINSSPTGNLLVADPMAAVLLAAEQSPDAYLQQSAQLAGLSESLNSDLEAASSDTTSLEIAQMHALSKQDEAADALAASKAAVRLADQNQRLAERLFLRVVRDGRQSAEEAWWVDQFAESGLGQLLAGLEGGPHTDLDFARPSDGLVTSPFGMRNHPILHTYKLHSGTDFSGGSEAVRAAASGQVVEARFDVAYGNVVVVWHGQNGGRSVATLYAHCASIEVDKGDQVRRGEQIALMGATGYATGTHLHFEVRLDGSPIDPEDVLR